MDVPAYLVNRFYCDECSYNTPRTRDTTIDIRKSAFYKGMVSDISDFGVMNKGKTMITKYCITHGSLRVLKWTQ